MWLISQDGRYGIKYRDTGRDSVAGEPIFSAKASMDYTDGMQNYLTQYICEEDCEEFARKT